MSGASSNEGRSLEPVAATGAESEGIEVLADPLVATG